MFSQCLGPRRAGLPLSWCPFKPVHKSENVKRGKKGKAITAPSPGRAPACPEVLSPLGHQYSPRQEDATWLLCPAGNPTTVQEDGKNERWGTQSSIHQLGATMTSGNSSELN